MQTEVTSCCLNFLEMLLLIALFRGCLLLMCIITRYMWFTSNDVFLLFKGVRRVSHLQAPIMLLTGHDGDIFCTKFSPNGQYLASAGFDRLVCEYKPPKFNI